MSREEWGLVLTFVLACISAAFFLVLRFEGKGRPFGPRSRRWALAVAGATGAVSTLAALGLAAIGHYMPSALVGLGIVAPSTLCLDRIRDDKDDRPSLLGTAATLWLGWLLRQVSETMAQDKAEWCEDRVNPEWLDDELILAAHSYHDFVRERLSPDECERHHVQVIVADVEERLHVARLIDSHAPRDAIADALRSPRLSGQAWYERNLDDLTRLGNRLQFDARRDVRHLLMIAYNARLYRLRPYHPPRWAAIPRPPAMVATQRATPAEARAAPVRSAPGAATRRAAFRDAQDSD
jgi:hypothetical protein